MTQKIDNSKYYSFRQKYMNKVVDKDGAYGCQCWDGYATYDNELGYTPSHCTSSGYVKDIWLNRKTNGMLTNHNEVTTMLPGCIAVFKEVPNITPYSHIAIFDSDINGKQGRFFGTNQGGKNGAFNIVTLPYSATYDTAFLPKCFIVEDVAQTNKNILNSIPSDFIYEKATFYPRFTIKIRKAPSLNGEFTGLYYTQGDHVNYDGYVKRENYVWLSWIGKDGTRRWMACGELNAKGVNTNSYGTFK